jgi:hypothetical protein
MLVVGESDGQAGLVRLDGATIADYLDTSTDWNQGTNTFGVCLHSVAGNAAPDWNVHASCPTTDGNYWNPIPAAVADDIATTNLVGETSAIATLRFGVRTAPTQELGTYVAPISFEVVAP